MRPTHRWLVRLAWVLSATLALPLFAAEAVPSSVAARGGMLWLRPNPELLARLGVQPEAAFPPRGVWELTMLPQHPIRVELADGAPTRLKGGELAVPALRLRRSDGVLSPTLAMIPDAARRLGWNLVDHDGGVWLRIIGGMRSPDRLRDGLRLVTADLRVGPALAAWTDIKATDLLFANASLRMPLEPLPTSLPNEKAGEKSCAVPNWPGTPGFITDVELTDMNYPDNSAGGVDVLRCRRIGMSGSCDGPGGTEGEVVIVPAARLRNRDGADATDVPWRLKFSGIFAPYGNDQHPFLVWNLYRLDAAGRIEQIARSGLKHAFATANDFCHPDANCPAYGNVLGRACQDVYNAGSNDLAVALSSRAEVIPALGVWGRCGSVYDDGLSGTGVGVPACDGVQDAPPNDDGYRHRLLARESDIDPAANPGAQYLIDAWYVVRDDVNIYNTMGYRSLQPQFDSGFWNPGALGQFSPGAVIDQWVALAPAGVERHRVELTAPEGHVGLATRVSRLQDGRYRYDYALMNFDFSRAVTDPGTAEPNLRIVRNLGLSAIELDLANAAAVDSSEYRDGDAIGSNDWPASAIANGIRWSAPVSATQDWGQLAFVSVTSAAAPSNGEMRIEVAENGVPGFYSLAAPVPDAAQVFRDRFE